MEAELMRVLQFAKRCVVTVAAVCVALTGCTGDTSPDAPFNPAGTTADMEAVNSTFASPTFASFSTFSFLFDAALGSSPLIAASRAALDIRGSNPSEMRASAARAAKRLGAVMPKAAPGGMSASAAEIPPAYAGKTFVYDVNTSSYVVSDRPLLDQTNKVRFILYAVDPLTFSPVVPLVETGYVDLIDLSQGSTAAVRVVVVSGTTTYLDYTVTASSSATSGRVNVIGYVTDGSTQANINVRSTLTITAGLTLTYALDVPQRDVSIDLTLMAADLSQPTGTVSVNLTMSGPNGTVTMIGEYDSSGGTLNVVISGRPFATITTSGTTTVITRTDGQPLTDDEGEALTVVFELTGEAFISFDQMVAPVGTLLGG
jgi:hypothetical protein